MRNFEITSFDFDFEEGVGSERTRNFRDGDDCCTLSGFYHVTVGKEQVFTPEREARIVAHQERIQAGLKARGLLWTVDNKRRKKNKLKCEES